MGSKQLTRYLLRYIAEEDSRIGKDEFQLPEHVYK